MNSRVARWALVLALSGCQPANHPLTPAQRAVAQYLKLHAADSASYEPVRWGPERTWRQRDWDALEAAAAGRRVAALDSLGRVRLLRLAAATTGKEPADTLRVLRNRYLSTVQLGIVTEMSRKDLAASADTLYRGTSLFHVYRLANTRGEAAPDSAYFTVRENGQVVQSRRKTIFFDEAF